MTLTNERLNEIIKIYNSPMHDGVNQRPATLDDLIGCKILDVYHHKDLESMSAWVIVTEDKLFILDHDCDNSDGDFASYIFMSKFENKRLV
jgi:hypothetical protein